ncbi:type II 3-dehydroquinate dehydratase [Carboxylicivirga taeanensis]|uniref:type II 3-dehydroquinate dehydratase n=1 Tax=Carboxylicivirga taeanensis TaxID=1416875 RepID=UPI003F6DD9AB
MNLLIINGPNLNLLGKRETSIYGTEAFEDYLNKLIARYPTDNITYYQSNSEGEIIDRIHADGYTVDGIIINAGAYTHTSLAIADAVSAIQSPVIEVHISNVHKREVVRHRSFLSPVCKGVIGGFGLDSYRLAIEALKESM